MRFTLRRKLCVLAAFCLGWLPGSACGDELPYFPDDFYLVVTYDVQAVRKSKVFARIMKEEKREPFELDLRTGIEAKDIIQTATFGIRSEMQGTSIYSIVTTKDPIGLDGLLARLKAGAPRGNLSFKETRVGDKVLYQKQWKIELNDRKEVDRVEEECFCIAEKNILITGDFKMVQKILQRKEKPRFSPHFAAALKKDGVPVRAIVDLATMPKELQKVFLEKKEWAAGLQMMSVSFRETGTVQFSLSLAFKDAERAAAVKNMVSAATMAGLVGLDWSFRDEPDAPEKDREVWKAGRTMLENGRVSLNGKEATAVYSIDIDMFPRLQRWVWAPRASSKKAK